MPSESPPPAAIEAWSRFLNEAVDEILRHEDADRFLVWVRAQVPARQSEMFPPDMPPEMTERGATMMGRQIWNATPLPSHGFTPRPLPKPQRNLPCPCGSGVKFKRCCAGLPALLDIEPGEIWPLVACRLSPTQLRAAIQGRHLPPGALYEIAIDQLEEGRPRQVVKLLEPIFADDLNRLDESSALVFNVLCNAYDELGWRKKKLALIDRLTGAGSRALRSEAWQRLAVVRIDSGEHEAAWAAHRQAQRLTPNEPSIGLLEVNLLMGDNRTHEASETARLWLKRLQREGIEADDPMLEFFSRVATNPSGTFSDLTMESAAAGASELRGLLSNISTRPLPAYAVVSPPIFDPSDPEDMRSHMHERLTQMGIPADQIDEAAAQFMDSLDEMDDEEPDESTEAELFSEEERPEFILEPPTALQKVEARWHALYPLEKPFSVNATPMTDTDPWARELFEQWFAFIKETPEAFDSLDILDDLSIALDLLEDGGWTADALMMPILDRAAAIVDQALSGSTGPVQLPWGFGENRPALRLLVKRAFHLAAHDDTDASLAATQRLLDLNPMDNHGLRGPVMNALLEQERDDEALALAERFPDDVLAEISLGRVLALYRQGRTG